MEIHGDPPSLSMPRPGQPSTNPALAQAMSQDATFASIAQEVNEKRQRQRVKWFYGYSVSGSVVGQQTVPFFINIEQGTDFDAFGITASAFSFDTGNTSDFPIPNNTAVQDWAGRGLSVRVIDTGPSRTLTSDFIAIENFGTPGYGLNFQRVFPFKYFFYRNSRVQFDIRNRDNANRTHDFEFVLWGYKYLTPMGR